MDVDDKVSKETSVKKSKKKKSKAVEPMAEDKPTAVNNGDDMEEEPKTEKKKKKKENKRKLEEEAEHENSQAATEEAIGMNGLNAEEGFAKKKKQSKGQEAEEDLAAISEGNKRKKKQSKGEEAEEDFLSSLTPLHRRCTTTTTDKSPEEREVIGKGRRKEKEVKDGSGFPILPFISIGPMPHACHDMLSLSADACTKIDPTNNHRWSLIAGRLPGRTANDVKNYWNSHLQKKLVKLKKDPRVPNSPKITEATIIKPRPRTFLKNPPCLKGSGVDNIQFVELNNSKPLSTSPASEANDDSTMEWWAKLFVELENNFSVTEEKVGFNNNMTGEWTDEMMIPNREAGGSIFMEEEGQKGCSANDFCVDIDVWDLLSCDKDFLT
ncbi:hypothetical protein LguiB_033253 [Lonicera macranthoides]